MFNYKQECLPHKVRLFFREQFPYRWIRKKLLFKLKKNSSNDVLNV